MNITLTESSAYTGHGFRLDKSAGIAYGVAVCGRESLNGRDYPDAVRDRDKHVYEGAQVFVDHSDKERKVREWFGVLKNTRTRVSDKKTIADHHFPLNSQFTEEFLERAERFPGSFGLSHVAECETKRINGRESITAIRKVHSVDLVAKPATNAGLFESVGPRRTLMEVAAKLCIGQRDPRRVNVLLEAVAVAGDDVPVSQKPVNTDSIVTSAEFNALADTLAELLKKFQSRLLSADQYRAAVAEVLDRLGHAAPGLSESRNVIPTDGAAFADWLYGRPSPEQTKAFLESIRGPNWVPSDGRKFAEVLRNPAPVGAIPTDGKAFAEWLKRGR